MIGEWYRVDGVSLVLVGRAYHMTSSVLPISLFQLLLVSGLPNLQVSYYYLKNGGFEDFRSISAKVCWQKFEPEKYFMAGH